MSDTRRGNLGYWTGDWPGRAPDRVAVIDLHGGRERQITYGMLDQRLDRVAHALRAAGLRPGDRMILSCGNRVEFIETMFGAMRAGVVPVPINTRQGHDVLAHVMADSAPRGVIAEPEANAAIMDLAAESRGLLSRLAIGGAADGFASYEDALATAPETAFAPPALADDALCFLSYTSGSTGRPKGVPLTHKGQDWWLDTYLRTWPPGEEVRNLVAVPLYHKNAMAGAVKPRLASGGSLVLMPDFSARPFLDAIARYRVTHISGVPTVFTLLLEERDLLETLDLSSLQLAVVGSAPVHEELEAAMAEKLGVPVLQSYGLTEGGPVMLGPPPDGRPVPRGSAGAAWPEGEVKLVAADGAESDTEGELWVRNPGVAPGYYNLPEVNAERYKDGWLKTGDLFRKDADGFFYFQGPRRRHVQLRRREHLSARGREPAAQPSGCGRRLCRRPVPCHQGRGAGGALSSCAPGRPPTRPVLKDHALKNGPAYAHPRRILIQQTPLPLTGRAQGRSQGYRRPARRAVRATRRPSIIGASMAHQRFYDGTEAAGGLLRAPSAPATWCSSPARHRSIPTGRWPAPTPMPRRSPPMTRSRPRLKQAGATLDDVVRLTIYITDIGQANDFLRAHAERFPGAAVPTSALIGGVDLLKPDLLVEIETTAVIEERTE